MNHGAGAGTALYFRHHVSCNPNVSCACPSRSPHLPEPHPHGGTTRGECRKELAAGAHSPPFARGLAEPAVMSSRLPAFSLLLQHSGSRPITLLPEAALIQSFPGRAGTTEGSLPSAGSSPRPGLWVPLSPSCYSAPHPPMSGTRPTRHLGLAPYRTVQRRLWKQMQFYV